MDDVVYMRDGAGGPPTFLHAGSGLRWSKKSHESQYHFVENDDTVAYLLGEHDYLYHVPGDRLEDVLGGSSEDAIAAIEGGEVDDILNVVLWAEGVLENRVTVLRAIAERSDKIESMIAQEEAEDDPAALTPGDVATRG